jgi:hypothetical protein
MRSNSSRAIQAGTVWQSKRDSWRRVFITSVHEDEKFYPNSYVNVKRNTSRRRQAINWTTLLKDYYLTDRTKL